MVKISYCERIVSKFMKYYEDLDSSRVYIIVFLSYNKSREIFDLF